MQNEFHYIHPDQLCIGLFIHLDMDWMRHSFTFNNFEIKTQRQIDKIHALKLERIRYDPLRSKVKPLQLAAEKTKAPPPAPVEVPAPSAAHTTPSAATASPPEARKFKLRAQRLMQLNKLVQDSKQEFIQGARLTREATRDFALNPTDSRAKAEAIVNDLVNSVITERDVVLHAVCSNRADPEMYVHALNVTVLALMLAKLLDMTEQEVRDLGLASILHDIGKNAEFRNRVILDQHCEDGARMVRDAGLPQYVADIILQHHECSDGSGHPKRLAGEQIVPLARVLSVVNTYDNLCNPSKTEQAMSPYEAVAHMYNIIPQKFDSKVLQLFIRAIGVYPPGSIVLLSNGIYGIVTTANPDAPLKPFVMIYAPNVPRKTLVIVDLNEEEGLSITRCIKTTELPPEVFEYFSPRSRVYYYMLKPVEDVPKAA